MERKATGRVLLAVLVALGISFSAGGNVLAAKPQAVLEWSNGFPSGEHFNLNIHGKKASYTCDGSAGGGSVFVPEYGTSDIEFIQNKKAGIDGLQVLDACGTFDGDAAQVQLPSGEYQVYARILGKPARDHEPREVIMYPSLVATCNDSGTENFTNATTCDESFLLGSGIITKNGVYDMDSGSLERIDTTGGKGKGKTMAVDMTELFQWSGWACNQTLDFDADGQISIADLNNTDLNGDGLVDASDLQIYLETNCTYFESEWVFNIADLVVSGWNYHNNGAKLVQVRFYPTDTTTFA